VNAAVLHILGQPPRYVQFREPIPTGEELLVHVRAAALKPVDRQMASGAHYASPRELPIVCGIDGVGRLEDGSRVFFAAPRRPFGAMAERTVVDGARCWPVPEGLSDIVAAALVNPGMSAWLTLAWRAKLAGGETVLVIGATGTTGRLAVQISKLLGAGRVIAAGRNEAALAELYSSGADAAVKIGENRKELASRFAQEAEKGGFHVILDYLWGAPTEALLEAITGAGFALSHSGRMRLVQVGESAGATISLPAAALRSSGLEILGAGSGAMPPMDMIRDIYAQLFAHAAAGDLRIATQSVPLGEVEDAWARKLASGVRLVLVP
jgi:NADPH:quinone reductase-like Zn-dependent oxidoreductase